jgi:thiamine biosynthesis lipoprotein ApbE
MRRVSLVLALAGVTSAAAVLIPSGRTFRSHYENVLGTSMDLTIRASSEPAAKSAEAAVLAQIDHDARILSGYDAASEFSRWFSTRDVATPVSPELFDVLALFDVWRVRTGGALDASAERVSRVWKAAAVRHELPSEPEIEAAVLDVRQPHWRLDRAARTATHLSGAPLILNSFTKSYIIDRAARAAMSSGPVRGVVVNIGGDLVSRGDWTEAVSIADPVDNADNGDMLDRLTVRNRAVATSGGYRRGFDIGGQHYSHIVDPRTGRPTSHVLGATVVAREAVDAGALATALCVLSPEDGERLVSSVPGAEFLLVLADGGQIRSAGWRTLEAPPVRRPPVSAPVATLFASEQQWNPGFELAVGVELARPAGMAKRPYLAIWIEDKDKFPVRTIALLYDQTRYLPELRAWYRADRLRAMAENTDIVASVASATRSPGSYTFKWDGKDQQGKLVKAGSYTVFIEVAREHGTYQLIRQELDFSGAAKRVDLPPNVEVAAASLDYRKIGR